MSLDRRAARHVSYLINGMVVLGLAGNGAPIEAKSIQSVSGSPRPGIEQKAKNQQHPPILWWENDGTPVDQVVGRYPKVLLTTTTNGTQVMQYADEAERYTKIVYNPEGGDILDGLEWVLQHCDGEIPVEELRGITVKPELSSVPMIESVVYFPRDASQQIARINYVQYQPPPVDQPTILAVYDRTIVQPYQKSQQIGAAYILAGMDCH